MGRARPRRRRGAERKTMNGSARQWNRHRPKRGGIDRRERQRADAESESEVVAAKARRPSTRVGEWDPR
jgi:hypothetical protein